MRTPMPDQVRRFLADQRYAVVATVNPDGSLHQAVTWYLVEGDEVVINSAEGRRWPANLRRDPRVSIAVEDGERNVVLRGTVELVDDPARTQADIAAMARLNDEPDAAEARIRDQFRRQRRVSFRLRPTEIHVEL